MANPYATNVGFRLWLRGTPFITFSASEDAKKTIARGVNKNGVVVGTWIDTAGVNRAFRRNASGAIDTFEFVPDDANWKVCNTVATGINNLGDIVGFFQVFPANKKCESSATAPQNPSYGFRLKAFPEGTPPTKEDFQLIDLNEDPTLAAKARGLNAVVGTHAQCINDAGHIGGRYFWIPPGFAVQGAANNDVHGFLLTDAGQVAGNVRTIDAHEDRLLTEVYGINSDDDVVGSTRADINAQVRGFLGRKANPPFESIGFPGDTFSRAMGIAAKTSSGLRVVGEYSIVIGAGVNSKGRGYVWDVGPAPMPGAFDVAIAPVPFASLKGFADTTIAWTTQAHGINDEGSLIVGEYAVEETGVTFGFMVDYAEWQIWSATRFQLEPATPVSFWERGEPGVSMRWPAPEPAKGFDSPRTNRQGGQTKSAARKSRKR